ncbi:MAG: DUF222 domain-containing protein, partial [Candidatus Eisenbacteria bacterium]|nr:DUF222 domain-containing protein [Candidatus Eisenbacteria bacterium]
MIEKTPPSLDVRDGESPFSARRLTGAGRPPVPKRKRRLDRGDSLFPKALLDPVPHYNTRTSLKPEEAQQFHSHLLTAARIDTQIDRTIGWLLYCLNQGERVQRLGFARMSDYIRERLGMSVRRAQLLIRLAKELRRLPRLARAHARGDIKTSKALCLLSVVKPWNEAEWVERAQTMTVRRLKEAVCEEKNKPADNECHDYNNPADDETLPEFLFEDNEKEDEEEDPETKAIWEVIMNNARMWAPWLYETRPKIHLNIKAPAAVAHLYDYGCELASRAMGMPRPQYKCLEYMLAEYFSSVQEDASDEACEGHGDDATEADGDAAGGVGNGAATEAGGVGNGAATEAGGVGNGAATEVSGVGNGAATEAGGVAGNGGNNDAAGPAPRSHVDRLKEMIERRTNQWDFLPKEKVHYRFDPGLKGGVPSLIVEDHVEDHVEAPVDLEVVITEDGDDNQQGHGGDDSPGGTGYDNSPGDGLGCNGYDDDDLDDLDDDSLPILNDPFEIDQALRQLIQFRNQRHGDMAALLTNLRRIGIAKTCQFLSFDHYCTDGLGISSRLGQDLVTTHRRLQSMPLLKSEYNEGRLSWSKTRLLAGICREETAAAWIERAGRVTVRRLELEVAWSRRNRETEGMTHASGSSYDGGPPPLSFLPPRGKDSCVRPGFGLWEEPVDASAGSAD